MSSQLPAWVQYLEALSAPAIALLAIVIGTMQWRTSHQRMLFDLFDRRMEIVEGILNVVAEILQRSEVTNDDSQNFLRATRDAEFLFGEDVTAYLKRTYTRLLDLHVWDSEIKSEDQATRSRAIEARRPERDQLGKFLGEFKALVKPYLQMRQRHLWL